ncbi:hypothetical protein LHGZ1_2296 [Laribacter hongkongensis]|uniref:Uncharacterized protein n=1 Tax=Laribacter hongkongensis TaxID=168471 RepID=A0A248LK46_9NEIS|nr:hypothetical protein LHGZ1_2296 [Laribacter hongkongensis]
MPYSKPDRHRPASGPVGSPAMQIVMTGGPAATAPDVTGCNGSCRASNNGQ